MSDKSRQTGFGFVTNQRRFNAGYDTVDRTSRALVVANCRRGKGEKE